MMREAQSVGEAFGVRFRIPIDKRIAGAEAIGPHKTSMLQDVEGGKPIEIEALLGSVIELARLAELATPHLDAICAVTRLLGHTLTTTKSRLALDARLETRNSGRDLMSAARTIRDLFARGGTTRPRSWRRTRRR